MKWDDNYAIGIDRIDSQHKKLIKLIADYSDSISRKDFSHLDDVTIEILNFLIYYTDFHFKTEEEFMSKINYPNLLEHKIEHKELISQVKELILKIRDNKDITPLDFYNFLSKWLKGHILIEDKKIGKYYTTLSLSSNFKAIDISSEKHLDDKIIQSLKNIIKDFPEAESHSNELELLRIIYLDDYFSRIKIVSIEDLELTLKLLKDLYVKDIISSEEKRKIYISLLPERKVKRLKLNSNNSRCIDSCLELIDWIVVN